MHPRGEGDFLQPPRAAEVRQLGKGGDGGGEGRFLVSGKGLVPDTRKSGQWMHGRQRFPMYALLPFPGGPSRTADTYVRRSWGNSASPIDPAEVSEVRGATAGRNRPWTEAELSRISR